MSTATSELKAIKILLIEINESLGKITERLAQIEKNIIEDEGSIKISVFETVKKPFNKPKSHKSSKYRADWFGLPKSKLSEESEVSESEVVEPIELEE